MDSEKKKKLLTAIVLVGSGFVFAIPFFLITNNVMLYTSTPEFCSSCHEHIETLQTWKESSHYKNSHGVVATCRDCHLPPFEDSVRFYLAKAYHGTKDITLHYFGPEYDREAIKKHVRDGMENSTCLRCHQNLLFLQHRGAKLAHTNCFWPKPGNEKKRCMDCHENLVHNKWQP